MSDLIPVPTNRTVSRKTLWFSAIALCLFYALLWSPWWYPLSDSALYLNMARALARGEGFESVRQMHRDVRPLTPLLLAGIMKVGGGIGAMHGVMILLMLLAHALTFLTLRRWFNERTALLATVATATSWWVYANAFTLMTEPLFLVMFWGAMLALSFVPETTRRKQWTLVIVAALLMAGAWENRVAAALLLPGILFGLWMSNRHVGWRIRAGWVASFAIIFAVLLWDYRRPAPGAEQAAAKEETYHLNVLVGVRNPLVDLPVSAGRWVIEGLAAASAVPFEGASKPIRILAGTLAIALFAIACLGWAKLWRGGQWYAIGMALYFLPCLVLWGARIKPRYMTPIAPVLFIQLWAGFCSLSPGTPGERVRVRGSMGFEKLGRSSADSPLTLALSPRSTGGRGNQIGTLLLTALLALNLVPYSIELYIRHGTPRNFYDLARRGGFAELIDMGAYVERNARPTDVIWVNWPPPSSRPPDANFAPDRRIVQFLTDREVRFMRPVDAKESDRTLIAGPADRERLDAFFQEVQGDWAVVYYSRLKWPSYHLPLAGKTEIGPRWWQLFHRDSVSGRFEPVDVTKQRNYVRDIPGLQR